MCNPWEEFPEIWPTKAKFFAWLRGNLRKSIWQFYPPKLKYKNSKCSKPPVGYVGRAKSGGYCELTGEWHPKSHLEIDHVTGEASLRDWEDVLPFVQHLCAGKNNMQIVGREAHKIKTYAERMGLTFEEAKSLLPIVRFSKLKVAEQKKLLTDLGVDSKMIPKNSALRTQLYKELKNG